MTKQTDKIAALEKKVEELEAKLSPPKPFVPEPYQRYDPTAGMCMPPSALRAMVNAEPRNFMREVVRDNRGPSTPTGMIPRSQQQPAGGGSATPGSGTGWGTQHLLVHLPASVTSTLNSMRKMRRIVPNSSSATPGSRRWRNWRRVNHERRQHRQQEL
jgi:hypothetical protein